MVKSCTITQTLVKRPDTKSSHCREKSYDAMFENLSFDLYGGTANFHLALPLPYIAVQCEYVSASTPLDTPDTTLKQRPRGCTRICNRCTTE